jgi:hypothetical protein
MLYPQKQLKKYFITIPLRRNKMFNIAEETIEQMKAVIKKMKRRVVKRKLKQCKFELESLEFALEYANISDGEEVKRLLKAHKEEKIKEKVLKRLSK